jgi:hypothetical protein
MQCWHTTLQVEPQPHRRQVKSGITAMSTDSSQKFGPEFPQLPVQICIRDTPAGGTLAAAFSHSIALPQSAICSILYTFREIFQSPRRRESAGSTLRFLSGIDQTVPGDGATVERTTHTSNVRRK